MKAKGSTSIKAYILYLRILTASITINKELTSIYLVVYMICSLCNKSFNYFKTFDPKINNNLPNGSEIVDTIIFCCPYCNHVLSVNNYVESL